LYAMSSEDEKIQEPELSQVENLKSVDDSSSSSVYSVSAQIAQETGHEIRYRSCSWQKTTALLMSEYICLAILSFPWSFSVLGMGPGVIVTI